MKKASVGMSDEFYKEIEYRDIEIMRRAQLYLFIAPTMNLGIVYILNKLRYELLMSQHFFYMIKRYQDKMQSKYSRKPAKDAPEQQNAKENSQYDSNLKQVYQEIDQSKSAAEIAKMGQLRMQLAGVAGGH